MKKLIVNLFWFTALISCSVKQDSKQNEVINLPYFNFPDFTPEWIEKGTSAYDSIHKVSDFSFFNQNGKSITQVEIEGKITIVNFFFTACPGICPTMMKNLLEIQNEFKEDNNFIILSHSVTPTRDSIPQLKKYANHRGIEADNWHLLTGDKIEIYEQARKSYFADEGFGKTVTTEDDFLHTENVLLIDKQKRIRGVYNGTLPVEINRLIEDVNFLKENE